MLPHAQTLAPSRIGQAAQYIAPGTNFDRIPRPHHVAEASLAGFESRSVFFLSKLDIANGFDNPRRLVGEAPDVLLASNPA